MDGHLEKGEAGILTATQKPLKAGKALLEFASKPLNFIGIFVKGIDEHLLNARGHASDIWESKMVLSK